MFNKDYILKGKHATFARNLCESNEKLQGGKRGVSVMRFGIDLLQIAPLIGAMYDEKKEPDGENNDRFTIQANAVIGKKDNLEVVFRLLMLTADTRLLTNDEIISRAFKEVEDEEKNKKNMDLFNSYVRGGIEWLHDMFTTNSTTDDDYLNDIKYICSQWYGDFTEVAE